MAADVQLDTVGRLYDTLQLLLKRREITRETKLFLASDEEGNQIRRGWAYGLEKPSRTVWTSRSVAGEKKLDYKTTTPKGAKPALILWPGEEELNEEVWK